MTSQTSSRDPRPTVITFIRLLMYNEMPAWIVQTTNGTLHPLFTEVRLTLLVSNAFLEPGRQADILALPIYIAQHSPYVQALHSLYVLALQSSLLH